MPPSRSVPSTRGLLAALTVAIAGVLCLDATAIVAAPRSASSPSSTSGSASPSYSNTQPALRLLLWSGQIWLVFPNDSNGPDGPHSLSDSQNSVHVDSQGRLHLKITKVNGKWRGVQLESLNPLNYGTYKWVVGSSTAKLAKPIVLGMFVYKPSAVRYTNEIDLEDSRSLIGLGYPRDAQYVVQPYTKPQNIHRYSIKRSIKTSTQEFDWRKSTVTFTTRRGASGHGKKVGHFHYSGPDVPDPSNEHIYINLHLHTKQPPTHDKRSVVIDSFSYTGPN